jgi:hypothetical protein
MSYVVEYEVQGDIHVDNSVLSRLRQTPGELARIQEIEVLGDDMTLGQYKELQQLKKNAISKTIEFNGINLTTDENVNMAHMYINLSDGTGYIPGHEGNNLCFKMEEDGLHLNYHYFSDNYDNNLSLVKKVATAFGSTIDIIYIGDEANDPDSVGEIIVSLKNGEGD